jgi:hypothetical protein
VGSFFIDLVPALWLGHSEGDREERAEQVTQMEQNGQLAQNHAREGSGFRNLEGENNVTSVDSERTLTERVGGEAGREEMAAARYS